MARMTRAEARQRRRERSNAGLNRSWMKYRNCDICGHAYCTNNYQDQKVRVLRWKGLVICPTCRYKVLPAVQTLVEKKVIKFRKQKNRG